MDVRAINYCLDQETKGFISMQVVLGHPGIDDDEEVLLLKHGGTGGRCLRWTLNDHDFITRIEYAYSRRQGYVTGVKFLTERGQVRTIGTSMRGRSVAYSYSEEKKFLGFMSFEYEDKAYAFGAYDSICNHLEAEELP